MKLFEPYMKLKMNGFFFKIYYNVSLFKKRFFILVVVGVVVGGVAGVLTSFFPVWVLRNGGKTEEINMLSKILLIYSLCLGAGQISLLIYNIDMFESL